MVCEQRNSQATVMEDTVHTGEQMFQGNDSLSLIWKAIEESLEDFNISESSNLSSEFQ